MTAITITDLIPDKNIRVCGHYIRAKLLQTRLWVLIVGTIVLFAVSGVYFTVFQVPWWIPFTHVKLFYLKKTWDDLFAQAWWPNDRHGERNLGEGLGAILVGAKALGSAWKKHYRERLSVLNFILRFIGSLALGILLIQVALWAATFGIAMVKHHSLHVHYVTPSPKYIEYIFVASGVIIGLIVSQTIWKPAGRTIQRWLAEMSATTWLRHNRAPIWIRLPLTTPALRERTVYIFEQGLQPTARTKVNVALLWIWLRIVLPLTVLTVIGFAVVGGCARYGVFS